ARKSTEYAFIGILFLVNSIVPHNIRKCCNSNDPVALADSIEWSGQNLPQLQSMGKASLQQAHSMTHQ
ncbi:hypothetical protein QUA20_16770, partial [Microcoleus sp. Pol7_A1]|uniref:hypothetical protein n=1 Tax=Microcoleus sp. Pol7_A1 TaxID=2818893 RepID=UPI002FD52A47